MREASPTCRFFWLLLAASIIEVSLGACAVGKRHPPDQQLLPLPVALDALQSLQHRAERLHSFRALMRLHYRDPRETHSSREAIVVARPDRLRVEVLSLFGSVFVLATEDGQLQAYVPDERTAYLGAASAENLWRYTRLWIPVEDLIDLLLATPGHERVRPVDCPGSTGEQTCLEYITHLGRATVWLDRAALPRRVEQSSADGTLLWTARYESFDTNMAVPMVKKLAVEAPSIGRQMTLQFHDLEINPELQGDEFTLQYPAETQIVYLDEVR